MAVNARLVIAENTANPELIIRPKNMLSVDTDISSSVDGSEVEIDVCEAEVIADYSINQGYLIPTDADDLTTSNDEVIYAGVDEQVLPQIPAGTEVKYYEGSKLIGLFYLDGTKRTGKTFYSLNMISAFGLLDDVMHAGGLYRGEPIDVVLASIINNRFEYKIGNPKVDVWAGGPGRAFRSKPVVIDVDEFISAVGGQQGLYHWEYYGPDGDGINIDGRVRRDVWVNWRGEIDYPEYYSISYALNPQYSSDSNGDVSIVAIYEDLSKAHDVTVYGWLPYDTARENLHTLLFATGLSIFKTEKGLPRFDFIDTSSVKTVPDAEVYAEGSVVHGAPVTSVAVTEHQFGMNQTAQDEVLFDNTDTGIAVQDVLVTFNEPYYGLTVQGNLSIGESGVNFCRVNGVGVLTGRKYQHTTRVIRRQAASANTAREKEVRVEDCTLITGLNSNNVLDRLVDYYTDAYKITGKMVLKDARPGSMISISNAFGEPENAIISRMQLVSSATVAASFEAIANYEPKDGGSYTQRIFLTASQTVTLPSGTERARIVLIGGGQGGQSGGNGHGSVSWQWPEERVDNGREGGLGGEPGSPGNVYIVDIDVSGPISFVIGSGGEGGEAEYDTAYPGQASEFDYGIAGADPVDGADGTATTATVGTATFSSANGAILYGGYIDIITGDIYAASSEKRGENGADGGLPGGYGGSIEWDGVVYTGGAPGTPTETTTGRGGGGAAIGANGIDGDGSTLQRDFGKGGNARDRDLDGVEARYGYGGWGGHGSGGGGAINRTRFDDRTSGLPGVGGKGGTGGPGLAILYY